MSEERKFIFKELDKKDFTHKEALRAVRCWFVIHTDTGGYVESDITFHRLIDGLTISRNDGDDFISIHDAEMIEVLRELLK